VSPARVPGSSCFASTPSRSVPCRDATAVG